MVLHSEKKKLDTATTLHFFWIAIKSKIIKAGNVKNKIDPKFMKVLKTANKLYVLLQICNWKFLFLVELNDGLIPKFNHTTKNVLSVTLNNLPPNKIVGFIDPSIIVINIFLDDLDNVVQSEKYAVVAKFENIFRSKEARQKYFHS